jgi:hypothetical protein
MGQSLSLKTFNDNNRSAYRGLKMNKVNDKYVPLKWIYLIIRKIDSFLGTLRIEKFPILQKVNAYVNKTTSII